jgi:hypothetical protein
MALTATERALLSRARQILVEKEQIYICAAIAQACHEQVAEITSRPAFANSQTHEVGEAAARLREYVMRSLGGYSTLDAWQKYQWQHRGGVPRDFEQRRDDRLAWLDWMLNEQGTEE